MYSSLWFSLIAKSYGIKISHLILIQINRKSSFCKRKHVPKSFCFFSFLFKLISNKNLVKRKIVTKELPAISTPGVQSSTEILVSNETIAIHYEKYWQLSQFNTENYFGGA